MIDIFRQADPSKLNKDPDTTEYLVIGIIDLLIEGYERELE